MAEPWVVLGGTFDPVHDGHLAIARAARARLQATVHFMPAGDPPHRAPPGASAAQRLAMLQLALGREAGLAIDTRELGRDGPSYTVDTVEALRAELGPQRPVVLVIGMDSLRAFTGWHRWRDILAGAHLLACTRPGQGIPPARELGELAPRLATDARELRDSPGGRILVEAGTAANISATDLRRQLAAGLTPQGLHPAVLAYIRHQGLYGPAGHGAQTTA